MNSLSWLLYFGSVSESVSSFLFAIALICAAMSAISIFIYLCLEGAGGEEELQKALRHLFRWTVPFFLVGGVISCLLPTKTTIYLIAASQTGQQVIKSPTGQKAIDAINRYLDNVGKEKQGVQQKESTDSASGGDTRPTE